MGCISSKLITRSISFHEERKRGSRRKANNGNGIPLLEDLIISASGSDHQYLALVCGANTVVSNKLHSRSFSSNSKLAIEPVSSETIDNLEMPSKLGQEGEKHIESDTNKRSKSWHWFPEHVVSSSLAQENLSKGAVGSRSFHTVEEYDDLVNKIWLSKSYTVQQSEFNHEKDGSGTSKDLNVSEFASNTSTTHHNEDKDSSNSIKKIQSPSLDKYSIEESKIVKEISIESTSQESSMITPSPKNEEAVSNDQKTNVVETESGVQGVSTIVKGNKRKVVANRLESLRIPSHIECAAIASLREWLPAAAGGGIYSPGSYITPKFGSYSVMNNIRNESESSEDSIFSPELVSAFEQCMQKLEAEEENILKQIMEEEESEDGASTTNKELHRT